MPALFHRLDNNAILLSGYTRHVTIAENEAVWLGMNFAAAWGDTDGHDGTNGNQPRFTTVKNNFVHEIGIYEKQSSMWFQAKSCQNTIEGNVAFNMPRAAINFNDGFGGATTVSNNLIWNTCRESGKHSIIDSGVVGCAVVCCGVLWCAVLCCAVLRCNIIAGNTVITVKHCSVSMDGRLTWHVMSVCSIHMHCPCPEY